MKPNASRSQLRQRFAQLLGGVASSLAAPAPPTAVLDVLGDHLTAGRRALAEKRPERVIEDLESMLASLAVMEALTWSVLGQLHEASGHRKESAASFKRSVQLYHRYRPDYTGADALDMGLALSARSKREEAYPLLGSAMDDAGTDGELLERIAQALETVHDTHASADAHARAAMSFVYDLGPAAEHFKKAAALTSSDGQKAGYEAAVAALGSNDDLAVSLANQAAQAHDGGLIANYVRAITQANRREFTAALEAIDAAREFPGNDTGLRLVRAEMLLLAGHHAEALVEARALAETSSPGPSVTVLLARTLAAQGRLDEALKTLESPAGTHPKVASVSVERSRISLELGRDDDALRHAQQAVELVSHGTTAAAARDRVSALALLGEALRRTGRPEEALAQLDEARSGSESAIIQGLRARLQTEIGATDEAEAVFRHAAEIDPGLGWVRAELGELLRREGRHQEALIPLDEAVRLHPQDAFALGTRGQVLFALGRYDEAVRDLCDAAGADPLEWILQELAWAPARLVGHRDSLLVLLDGLEALIERRPDVGLAHLARAEALRYLGRSAEGLAEVNAFLTTNAADPVGRAVKAFLLADLGQFQDALDLADAVLLDDELEQVARSARIRALMELDRTRDALVDVERALADGLDDVWFLRTKGYLLALYGRFAEARETLEIALERSPDAPTRFLAGCVMRRLGDPHRAIELLRTAVDEDPTALWYATELAEAQLDAGDEEAADATFRDVLTRDGDGTPEDPFQIQAIAQCHLRLGHHDRAAAGFQEALLLRPNDTDFRFSLGMALILSGRVEVALDEYECALQFLGDIGDPDLADATLTEALRDLRSQARTAASPEGLAEAEQLLTRAASAHRATLEEPDVQETYADAGGHLPQRAQHQA